MNNADNIVHSPDDDSQMVAARQKAQATFKYFWRELSWEHRRIIKGLDIAIVKIMFTDTDVNDDEPSVEHMWVGDVEFDGQYIRGFLMNPPNWLRNISEGDHVKATLADVSDWLFSVNGKVFGGYTVNLLRSRMSGSEMKAHDQAWGLNFGDPKTVELVYTPGIKTRRLGNLFRQTEELDPEAVAQAMIEHPMSINMEDSLLEHLQSSEDPINIADEQGWTLLHKEALAGNGTSVKVLLDNGADKQLKNQAGFTPLALAKILDWPHVIDLLS